MSPAERKLADLEAVFGALAHEQRRHILLTLEFRGGQMTAGDIARRFACSWPTTTGHLQALEKAGLVRSERRGRERLYRLDADRLRAIVGEWLAWFSSDRSDTSDRRPSHAALAAPAERPAALPRAARGRRGAAPPPRRGGAGSRPPGT